MRRRFVAASARRIASYWDRLVSRWCRIDRLFDCCGARRCATGSGGGRRRLTLDALESRDPPSDTLGAVMGNLGGFGLASWLSTSAATDSDGVKAGSVVSLRPSSSAQGIGSSVDLATTLLQLLGDQVQTAIRPSAPAEQSDARPLWQEDALAGAGLRDVFFQLDSGFGSASSTVNSSDGAFFTPPESSSSSGGASDASSQGAAKSIGEATSGSSTGVGFSEPGGSESPLGFVPPSGMPTVQPAAPATFAPSASITSPSAPGIEPEFIVPPDPTPPPAPLVNPDTDADGVPGAVEALASNGGDGNNDGTPDAEQANVATVHAATGAGFVTIDAQGHSLASVRALRGAA